MTTTVIAAGPTEVTLEGPETLHKLLPWSGYAVGNWQMGASVSLDGEMLISGAPYDNVNSSVQQAGAVYVHMWDGNSWWPQKRITPASRIHYDNFGFSVALSNGVAAIGAPALFNNTAPGSVYIYRWAGTEWYHDTWNAEAHFSSLDGAADDRFGTSVAISGDTVIVGAFRDDDKGSNSGSAYVFIYDSNTSTWVQQDKLLAADGASNDYFGKSVAISGDYAVVGADSDDDVQNGSGSAYVFKRTGVTWSQMSKLTAADPVASGNFGVSVAIQGDLIAVGCSGDDDLGTGSGSVTLFRRAGETWSQVDKVTAIDGAASAKFGKAVALSGDNLAVGAYGMDSNKGAAYAFANVGSDSWEQQHKTTEATAGQALNDYFGTSVSISGSLMAIGASGDDQVVNGSGAAYIDATTNEISIAENAANDTVLASIWTNDPDTPIADQIFTMTDSAGGRFKVEDLDYGDSPWKLMVADNSLIDYETATNHTYSVTIEGSDGVDSASQVFDIIITNANEAPSDISLSNDTVDEHVAGAVVGTLSTTDEDQGDSHTYSVAIDASGKFTVDGSSLKLLDTETLDFETQTSYDVTIRSHDQGNASFDKLFTITVNNGNDPPNEITLTPQSVDENSPGAVVGVLTANDPNSDAVTFSLVDDAGGLFEVSTTQLKLAAGVALDRETQSSYQVTVKATDIHSATFDKDFTITVNDVNEVATHIILSGYDIGLAKSTTPQAADGHLLGSAVAVSGDWALAGIPEYGPGTLTTYGAAMFYKKGDTGWASQVFKQPASSGDKYGSAVAISNGYAVVGAPFKSQPSPFVQAVGYAYFYKLDGSGTSWTSEGIKTYFSAGNDNFGSAVAINNDKAVVGVPNLTNLNTHDGAVILYERDSGGTWNQTTTLKSQGGANDNFGLAVAMDGDYIFSATPLRDVQVDAGTYTDAGAVYVFNRDAGASWDGNYDAVITAPVPAAYAWFGNSVAYDSDYLVVGAKGDGTAGYQAGAVHIYKRDGSSWNFQQTLTAGDAEAEDRFGESVSISGETILVGARMGDTGGTADTGAVYVFQFNGTQWSESRKLNVTDASLADQLGMSVGISGTDIIAGSNKDDNSEGTDAGAVVFGKLTPHIAEHSPGGTVVTELSCVDPDGDPVTFSLTDDAGGRFTIIDEAGIWKVVVANGALINFEIEPTISLTVEADDSRGGHLATSFTVQVTDIIDDPSGFHVSAISDDVSEFGTTATFTVSLTSQPTAQVVLPLASLDTSEGTINPASLTFNPSSQPLWSTPQTVTVTGVDDFVVDGDVAFFVQTGDPISADGRYNGAAANPADVAVANLDNDVDTDNDGVLDATDNCINDYNPDQANATPNPQPGDPGNACDTTDADNDGISDMDETICGSNPADPKSRCNRGMPWLMLLRD